jgi:hypothetical protein
MIPVVGQLGLKFLRLAMTTKIEMIRVMYEGKSIIIRNAVVFVFLLATLSFCAASPCVVFLSLFPRRFDVARSVPSSLPCR